MEQNLRTREELAQLQSLPLEAKIILTKQRIKEWYDHFNGDVCVSFSGGKDSTVLAHIVHSMYPDVPLVFANTGLEYPEIQQFARKMGATFVRPKMSFAEVITQHGYPIIGKEVAECIQYARKINGSIYTIKKRNELTGNRIKQSENGPTKSIFNKEKWFRLCRDTDFRISRYCCDAMKKSPLKQYQHRTHCVPYIGTQAVESEIRKQKWLHYGCNAFDGPKKTSQPLSFWTEQDIFQYIVQEGIEIASVYGDIVSVDKDGFVYLPEMSLGSKLMCTGCERTGCIFCGFGFHLEKGETRFQRLAKTHPKQYEYCLGGGQYIDNPDYDPDAPEYDGEWKNWNPPKIWVPSKEGLGMKHVFDACNEIYGKDFMRYE